MGPRTLRGRLPHPEHPFRDLRTVNYDRGEPTTCAGRTGRNLFPTSEPGRSPSRPDRLKLRPLAGSAPVAHHRKVLSTHARIQAAPADRRRAPPPRPDRRPDLVGAHRLRGPLAPAPKRPALKSPTSLTYWERQVDPDGILGPRRPAPPGRGVVESQSGAAGAQKRPRPPRPARTAARPGRRRDRPGACRPRESGDLPGPTKTLLVCATSSTGASVMLTRVPPTRPRPGTQTTIPAATGDVHRPRRAGGPRPVRDVGHRQAHPARRSAPVHVPRVRRTGPHPLHPPTGPTTEPRPFGHNPGPRGGAWRSGSTPTHPTNTLAQGPPRRGRRTSGSDTHLAAVILRDVTRGRRSAARNRPPARPARPSADRRRP